MRTRIAFKQDQKRGRERERERERERHTMQKEGFMERGEFKQ